MNVYGPGKMNKSRNRRAKQDRATERQKRKARARRNGPSIGQKEMGDIMAKRITNTSQGRQNAKSISETETERKKKPVVR